uniref:Putative secreted protein n=1 Tax=Anopheles triannulatus TaxID=58253 RepID=A0A2M4B1H0_9DIPT
MISSKLALLVTMVVAVPVAVAAKRPAKRSPTEACQSIERAKKALERFQREALPLASCCFTVVATVQSLSAGWRP